MYCVHKNQLSGQQRSVDTGNRYRPRFFEQVEHQTKYASIGNRHFPLCRIIVICTCEIMNRDIKHWAHI